MDSRQFNGSTSSSDHPSQSRVTASMMNGQHSFNGHEDTRTVGKSGALPIKYKGHSFPSASEALEAYISDHGSDSSYKIRTRYARELERLLISKYSGERHHGYRREDAPRAEDLRRQLTIKRLVDESYEKLENRRQSQLLTSSHPVSGGHFQGLPPPEQTSQSHQRRSGHAHHPSGDPHSAHITVCGPHHNGMHPTSWNPRRSEDPQDPDAWHERLLSQSQLDNIRAKLRQDAFGGPRTADSSHSTAGRDGAFVPVEQGPPVDRNSTREDSLRDGLMYDPGNIRLGSDTGRDSYARRTEAQHKTPPVSSYYGDGDDTMSQLLSSKKTSTSSQCHVPSWVEAIAAPDTCSSHGNNSTILTGLGQKPSEGPTKAVSTPNFAVSQSAQGVDPSKYATQLLTTPKKQLRFDLDLTGLAVDDVPRKQRSPTGLTLRTVNGHAGDEGFQKAPNSIIPSASPPKSGILKSPQKKETRKPHDVSFTMEDIAFGALQYGRSDDDFPEKTRNGRHSRSFSASGRLSSTPVKSSEGRLSIYDDRPCLSELSSVRGSSGPSSVASDTKYDFLKNPVTYDPVLDLYKVVNTQDTHRRDPDFKKPVIGIHGSKTSATGFGVLDRPINADILGCDMRMTEPQNNDQRPYSSQLEAYAFTKKPATEQAEVTIPRTTVHPKTTNPDFADAINGLPASCPPLEDTSSGAPGQEPNSAHKEYLRDLVRDIEDGSSSIVTALTDIQELLHPSGQQSKAMKRLGTHLTQDSSALPPGALMVDYSPPLDDLPVLRDDLPVWPPGDPRVLPSGDSMLDGLRTPSELSDLPVRASGLEESPGSDAGQGDWQLGSDTYPPLGSSPEQRKEFHHKKGGIVDKFLQECRELQTETEKILTRSYSGDRSGGEPVGTMEALKNMLFTMQSLSAPDQGAGDGGCGLDPSVLEQLQSSCDEALSPATKQLLASQKDGDSLGRAMMHLDRLKSMVRGQDQS